MNAEDIIGKVLDMAGLADYQDGSIVSRTVIDKPAGTLTFFAFDKGQGLSEHTAPFDALVYVLDGEVEITISGRPLLLLRLTPSVSLCSWKNAAWSISRVAPVLPKSMKKKKGY